MGTIQLDDTIVAISTPIGEGGIGIVRLSGKDALKIVDNIFLPKNGNLPSAFETYTVHYGHIIERITHNARRTTHNAQRTTKIVDEVILTIMRAPRSYTKEDVVEINCHSGIVPLKKILDLVLMNGARLAEPGEFTKRAFLNGRIDILQAESVLDIIKAKTDLSLKLAVNNLKGLFSTKIKALRDRLMELLVHIDASIDFSDEADVGQVRRKDVLNNLKQVKKDIDVLIATAYEGKVLRQGMRTVICGSPNVGKSSLMNALLKEPRVIVTDVPGTTRDTVEEIINIKGIPVILIDTAGITDTSHIVEREGIRRSHVSIETADLILLVLDYGRKLNINDLELIRTIKGKSPIIVVNKQDLKNRIDIRTVRKFFSKEPIVFVSALNLSGIDKLEDKIYALIFAGKVPAVDSAIVSNDRQIGLLRCSAEDIKGAIEAVVAKVPIDCVAIHLRSSIENLGGVTGENISEEALDRIFSEFCIGK